MGIGETLRLVRQVGFFRFDFYLLVVFFSAIATLRLHLGFSAKLRTGRVSACKTELQSGSMIND